MSRSNLLKTTDVTFLDLVGNGKKYHVPPFQRDYSWDQEQWEDLWNDVLEMLDAPSARHYMGALVVEALSDREFEIIDGQQRISTLSILALAVIDTLRESGQTEEERAANVDRATRLRERFIGERDPASLLESSKLFLNETDNAFYQDYLVQLRRPLNPRGLPRSNRLLWECFRWFRQRLDKQQPRPGEWFARLLAETVGRQLLFILITVEDELSAYTVFETLNARGLELSATDLLKNYLFSRVKVRTDLDALQRRWATLVNIVRPERFPDFLRYHLLCEQPQVRKQRLFKEIRDAVRTPIDVFALMDALEARAELYAAINDPEHEYWIDNAEARPYVREMQLFGVKQMTPLLFAAYERLNATDFARVVKLVAVISFRYTIVSGLNPNELEPVYHRAAKALLTRQIQRPADLFTLLRDIYVPDDKFQRDFEVKELATSGQRKRLARYVLCRLEGDAASRHVDFETEPATIEHILPENPGSEWESCFPVERQKSYMYRLGNLTLLEPSVNRLIGNGGWQVKLAGYHRSHYASTTRIALNPPEEWSPAALEARQRHMAERAVHLWRADFA
ncbi:MAG: DUF262 domain-containing HNH endonuclease family protein [Xanthomonadales bacterium]|nr:DUF262 domain-containing HNH endonuclease family protein [Xanthomonadales bacterium]